MTKAIDEGLTERKMAREKAQAEEKVVKAAKEKQKADKAKSEVTAEDKKDNAVAEKQEGDKKAPRKRLTKKEESSKE